MRETPANMVPPNPLMYAELLSNIRQISVIIALEEPCGSSTKVELSADGRRFILHHAGATSSLRLPGQVTPSSQLQKPTSGAKEFTWRLPLAGQPTHPIRDNVQSSDAPWSAKCLGEEVEFYCRDCGAVVVKKGSIRGWRDLPSENWAEMMDFWHCHRPDVPVSNGPGDLNGGVGIEESMANRGYGANTKFTPTPGIGFIDLTTFLLVDRDCTNIQVRRMFSFKTRGHPSARDPFGGIKKVARLAFAIQWLSHRYKCPRLTPSYHSAQQQSFMSTLFSR
jgi:hypothetical protein